MSKLLQSQLPISVDGSIDGNLYNRLVRILEINLGSTLIPPLTNGAYAEVKLCNVVSAAPNETDNNSGISS